MAELPIISVPVNSPESFEVCRDLARWIRDHPDDWWNCAWIQSRQALIQKTVTAKKATSKPKAKYVYKPRIKANPQVGGIKIPSFILCDPDGVEHMVTNQVKFAESHGLCHTGVARLRTGAIKKHHGWTFVKLIAE